MKNLAQRVSTNNCVLVYGLDRDTEEKSTVYLIKMCMEAGCRLTSSEEEIIDDFLNWYRSINWDRPYSVNEPAWFYCNLNGGFDLLVQVAVPCEGAVTDGALVSSTWRPGRVKMI